MPNVVEDHTPLSPAKVRDPSKQKPAGPAATYSADSDDWNEHRTFISQVLDFVGGWVQNFFRAKHHPSPPTTASDEISLVSNGGQAAVSEGGGPYIWIKAVDYVNAGDKRFGLNGLGVVDDAAALAAAIQATAATSSSDKKNVLVLPSDVLIRIANKVTVPAALGFTMIGSGKWSSQILVDPAPAHLGADGLVINSSQHVTLEGFGIAAKASNPAGKMLFFDYNPVVNAGTAFVLRDLWILLNDGDREGYDYGIYWSDAYGNNSEASYENVTIEGYKENGVTLPGTQQKGHVFRNTQLNGHWAGADPAAAGGKFGIWANGGSFSFRDGGVGYCRKAAFSINFPTEPIVIDDVDMEGCWQIYGNGSPSSGLAGSGTRQIVAIRNCRYDVSATVFDATGVIQVGGVGSADIDNNSFYAGDGSNGQTLIALAPGFPVSGVSVRKNQFLTSNSKDHDPIAIYGTAVNYRQNVDCRDNLYADGSGTVAYRNEALNAAPAQSVFNGPVQTTRAQDLFTLDLTQFNAAAASQILDFLTAQPKALTYFDWRTLLYNYVVVSGGATLTIRVGTTSGGDELLQDTVLGGSGVGDSGAWYGEDPTQRGTALMSVGGHMPNGLGTSHVYVTVTASTGNLGNGTVSNITRGVLHFAAEYKLQPRFIT